MVKDQVDVRPTDEEIGAIFALGRNFLSQGKFVQAEVIFGGLSVLAPQDPAVAIALGQSLLSLGQYQKAYHHLEAKMSRFIDEPIFLLLAARVCLALAKNDEAKSLLQKIIQHSELVDPMVKIEAEAIMQNLMH